MKKIVYLISAILFLILIQVFIPADSFQTSQDYLKKYSQLTNIVTNFTGLSEGLKNNPENNNRESLQSYKHAGTSCNSKIISTYLNKQFQREINIKNIDLNDSLKQLLKLSINHRRAPPYKSLYI